MNDTHPGARSPHRRQAVVIGGSMAGLVAARVLADHFQDVTIVERDPAPTGPAPRRGTPQSHHAHVLLKRGELILEELFPGLTQELVAGGAYRIDPSAAVCWYHYGHWKIRYRSRFRTLFQTRPFLEWLIFRRVVTHPRITFRGGTAVTGLDMDAEGARVVGVRVRSAGLPGAEEHYSADLVMDASGQGTRAPAWLSEYGFPAPPESALRIGLTYTSRLYRAPVTGAPDWRVLLVYPRPDRLGRAGYVFSVENGCWLVTLAGYAGAVPPTDEVGFLQFAQDLARPDVYDALRTAEPLGEPVSYGIARTTRRHYERLSRLPEGFLAIGDTVCRLDPVFGQGMTVAAWEAQTLGRLLRDRAAGADWALTGLPRRYYRAISRVIGGPWQFATSEASRDPRIEGDRPRLAPVLQWYAAHIFALAETDRTAFDAFVEVLNLVRGPEALFAPPVLARVLARAAGLSRRAPHAARPTAPPP